MAEPSANLRVRISADLNDIKQGLSTLRSQLATVRQETGRPLPASGIEKLGVSAGQTAAAMRQLPAQITDIVVSLQGGMPFFTVLLQQGGQIKDMFGGLVPALDGVATAVSGMINPYTLAAAGVGALALAWKLGSDESQAFNQAIISTANYAGLTAESLAGMARELGRIDGSTTGRAAEALTKVASTGKFTADQIDMVAKAAEQMRAATGKSIEETIAEFESLRKEPVSAILDLNEKYHFLTDATLQQIRALKEQGSEAMASQVAMRALADMINTRTPQMVQNANWLGRAYRIVTDEMSKALDAWKNIGRADTQSTTGRLQEVNRAISYQREQMKLYGEYAEGLREVNALEAERGQLQRKLVEQGMAAMDARVGTVDSAAERRSEEARNKAEAERKQKEAEWDRLAESNLSKREKLEAEIAKIRANGIALGKDEAEIQRQIANARSRFNESDTRSNRAAKLTEEQRASKALLEQYTSLNAQQERQLALYGDTSRAAAAAYDIQLSGLSRLDPAMAQAIQANASLLDVLDSMSVADSIIAENNEVVESFQDATGEMSSYADQSARNMQSAFADFLFDPFEKGLDGLAGSFTKILQRMAAEAASAQLLQAIWGGGAQYTGTVGSLFGGEWGFAEGGFTGPGGKFEPAGIVHKGEGVLSQRDVAAIGGPQAFLEMLSAIRRGRRYADGGFVGSVSPRSAPGSMDRVIINNNTGAQPAVSEQPNASGGTDILVMIDSRIRSTVGSDFAQGGPISKQAQAAFGLARRGNPRG